MKLLSRKIPTEILTDDERDIYISLNNKPYGEMLARKVAQKLMVNTTESNGLYHSHRDYCGMGLYIHEGKFTLGTVNDGRGPYPIVATFDSEADFVQWLANENDQSMALYGEQFNNQTLTKMRLDWYLDEDYSSIWNAYCAYKRKRINNIQ